MNWTDLHVFTVPGAGTQQLVLAMGVDAAVSAFPVNYLFPTDAKFRFLIDNEPEGADLDPNAIYDVVEDVTFDVTFRTATDNAGAPSSVPTVTVHGLRKRELENPKWLAVFAGTRDDPFIRGPRQGRSVAAVVLQLPLKKVLAKGGTLHIWGTTGWPRATEWPRGTAGKSSSTGAPSTACGRRSSTSSIRHGSLSRAWSPSIPRFRLGSRTAGR